MLISSANASAPSPTSTSTGVATTTGAGVAEPSPFSSIIPLVLIFVVFYFLLIRPQQKKLKEHGPSSIYKYVLIVLTISNVRGPSIILEIQTK